MSVPGSSDATRARGGFTLVEMLVVLLLLGLGAGLASAVFTDRGATSVAMEASRLAERFELAAAEARLAGRPLGWTSDGSSYRFWRLDAVAGWTEVAGDDPLRSRTLSRGVTIAGLRIENFRPQAGLRLEWHPGGAASAFDVELASDAERWWVRASPVGAVDVVRTRAAGEDGVGR
jgi:general secretion pathway protein H